MARAVRPGGATHDHRGAGTAPRGRCHRDQRPRDGDAGPREAAGRVLFASYCRLADDGGSGTPILVSRPLQLLRRRLQHQQGAALADPCHVRGLRRPEMEGTHRDRSHRLRVDGDTREDLGHDQGMDYFRELSALRPDVRQGHVLLAGSSRRARCRSASPRTTATCCR